MTTYHDYCTFKSEAVELETTEIQGPCEWGPDVSESTKPTKWSSFVEVLTKGKRNVKVGLEAETCSQDIFFLLFLGTEKSPSARCTFQIGLYFQLLADDNHFWKKKKLNSSY